MTFEHSKADAPCRTAKSREWSEQRANMTLKRGAMDTIDNQVRTTCWHAAATIRLAASNSLPNHDHSVTRSVEMFVLSISPFNGGGEEGYNALPSNGHPSILTYTQRSPQTTQLNQPIWTRKKERSLAKTHLQPLQIITAKQHLLVLLHRQPLNRLETVEIWKLYARSVRRKKMRRSRNGSSANSNAVLRLLEGNSTSP
jgi:hypothetical protein